MVEEWRDIEGFEGLYQVSNLGEVKSLRKERALGHSVKVTEEHILRPSTHRDGYLRVVLMKDHVRYTRLIHRLVAQTFISNPENKPTVNHLDEIKTHNSVDNLEWATISENTTYGNAYVERVKTQKMHQPKSKVVYQYTLDKELVAKYTSAGEAARQTGVIKSGIQHCANGHRGFKTYKGYIWRYEEIKS